jgi:hypothetical protein
VKINGADHTQSIHLKVPFYRQHYDFTCGPASLMMALKYFDNNLRLTKDLEIDIWREGNMVEVYGTSRYGIAYSAVVRGFYARVTSNNDQIDFVDRLIPPIENLNMQVLKFHFDERRNRCRKLGVKERLCTITEELICDSLLSGYVPLMVTNALFCESDNLPHWVVVTGIDERFVYFNNPLDTSPRKRKFVLSDLHKFIGFRGDQAIVEILKPP